MQNQFTHMLLNGGGISGLLYLGVFRYLKQEGYDKNIRNVGGVSIGALFATAFALDIPLQELEELVFENFGDKIHESKVNLEDIMTNYLVTKEIFNIKHFTYIIEKHVGNMTFMDLSKRTGKNLYIIATHLNKMQCTIFSLETTPNVLIIDAVQASATLPLISAPKKIGNDYYIDGGISMPGMPIIFKNVNKENILLVSLKEEKKYDEQLLRENILYYITSVVSLYLNHTSLDILIEQTYPYYLRLRRFAIPFLNISIMDNTYIYLKATKEEIEKSIEYGYEDTHEWFKDVLSRKQLNSEQSVHL